MLPIYDIWSIDNLKKTGFNRYFYYFSVDYYSTDADDVKYIPKYLMKEKDVL